MGCSHCCTCVRWHRGMRSIANKEAPQAASAPARMRCVPPECGGMRRRERVLLRLLAACGCVESFCTFRVFSTPRECTTFDGFAMLSHCCDSAVYSMVVLPAPIRMRAAAPRVRWWVLLAYIFGGHSQGWRFVTRDLFHHLRVLLRVCYCSQLARLLLRWMLFCVGCYCCVFWWELSWRRRRS
jgi:hypothetical protein